MPITLVVGSTTRPPGKSWTLRDEFTRIFSDLGAFLERRPNVGTPILSIKEKKEFFHMLIAGFGIRAPIARRSLLSSVASRPAGRDRL